MRVLVTIIYKIFFLAWFRLSCVLYTWIAKIILFVLGVHVGRNFRIMGGSIPQFRISKGAKLVRFGDNVIFNNHNDVGWYSNCAVWVREGATLIIGNNTGLNGALIYSSSSVVILNNVKIGGGTRVFDTDFHPIDYIQRRNTIVGTSTRPVVLEDDVFIGTNCIICKGVTIGKRSIVAAGSVVTKSIPSDEIWGGNPAKFIRKI